MDYNGYIEVEMNNDSLAEIMQTKKSSLLGDISENEYVIAHDENGTPVYFKYANGEYLPVKYTCLKSEMGGILKPLNEQQYCAFDMLMDKSIPVKLITGRFGSGKSLSCIIYALSAVEQGDFEKIIFVRNNVQLKDTDPLGALPGLT